jgi:hypothetical protein
LWPSGVSQASYDPDVMAVTAETEQMLESDVEYCTLDELRAELKKLAWIKGDYRTLRRAMGQCDLRDPADGTRSLHPVRLVGDHRKRRQLRQPLSDIAMGPQIERAGDVLVPKHEHHRRRKSSRAGSNSPSDSCRCPEDGGLANGCPGIGRTNTCVVDRVARAAGRHRRGDAKTPAGQAA